MHDASVDVIIVGSGYAGLSAAIEAHLAGASVLVIEKMAGCGGNSVISDGGIVAAGTRFQQAAGIDDSPEKLAKDMLQAGLKLNHADLVTTLATRSAETLDWTIEELGVSYLDRIDRFGGHSVARSHIPVKGGGAHIFKKLLARVRELEIPIRLRCRLTGLLTNSQGRVTGVEAAQGYRFNGEPGTPCQMFARHGVILAAGGFAADVSFRRAQDPRLDASVDTTNKASATGEVIECALKVGALPLHLSRIQLGPWTSADEKGFGAGPAFGSYVGLPYGLMVDPADGRRFVNELADRKVRADAILALGHPAVAIADAEGLKAAGADISRALKKGVVKGFDSIAELARHYSIPLEPLEETVQRFNQAFEGNSPDEQQKPRLEQAAPLVHPPFYAMRIWPKTHYTPGGILIDTSARVLDFQLTPIEGLFAAGEITGGVHGASRLGSCAITDCFVFGRIAGRCAGTHPFIAGVGCNSEQIH